LQINNFHEKGVVFLFFLKILKGELITMAECELFENCDYIKKLGIIDRVLCAGTISIYCKGEELENCQIRKFYKTYERLPPADYSPEGSGKKS